MQFREDSFTYTVYNGAYYGLWAVSNFDMGLKPVN